MSERYNKIRDQLLKSMAKPTPEALYHQLARLRNEMPNSTEVGKPSTSQWIGRVLALVDAAGCYLEAATLRTYFDHATRNGSNEKTAVLIAQLIDTAIAALELRLPAEGIRAQ
jgi:hypothetical protein